MTRPSSLILDSKSFASIYFFKVVRVNIASKASKFASNTRVRVYITQRESRQKLHLKIVQRPLRSEGALRIMFFFQRKITCGQERFAFLNRRARHRKNSKYEISKKYTV